MADTGERDDIRDRLAAALYGDHVRHTWAVAGPFTKKAFLEEADALLAALPTVGLRIGRVEE